jgi:hypothetical protein
MKRSLTPLVFAAVVALAVTGCTSTSTQAEVAAAPGQSPLAAYMGETWVGMRAGGLGGRPITTSDDGSPDDQVKQRKVEDGTAKCMQAAGFKYVAVEPTASKKKSKYDAVSKLPPDQYAAQYGYGISTIDWAKDAKDFSDASGADNPNTAIRKALSPSAQKAYDKALDGATAEGAVPIDKTKGESADLGCRGKATNEVYKSDQQNDFDPSKFDGLFKDLEALSKRAEVDERVVAATKAWSDCMADGGYSGFKTVDEPSGKVTDKLNELGGSKGSEVAPALDKADPKKLAELRKYEISMAKADLKCRTSVYDKPYEAATFELEKEFVNSHKTELEQYREGTAQK